MAVQLDQDEREFVDAVLEDHYMRITGFNVVGWSIVEYPEFMDIPPAHMSADMLVAFCSGLRIAGSLYTGPMVYEDGS